LAAIRRFVALTRQMRVADLHVRATAAPREAANGPEFIAAVEALTGGEVVVLSGAEEAQLAALGVVSGFHKPDGVAGDLGGGSLEMVEVKDAAIGIGETYPLGGLALEQAADRSLKKAQKIADRRRWRAAATGPFMRSAALGGRWPGCTCARPAIRSMSRTPIPSPPTRRPNSAAWSRAATSTRSIRSRWCRATAARCCLTGPP
jgi:exopolyphosphatase/guanosine-5'-triphosphate,3'-diphosphate pyrophosphatase